MVALACLQLTNSPCPIESIRDITGAENYLKTSNIQVTCGNSYNYNYTTCTVYLA